MEVSPDGNVVQIPLSDEERIAGVPTLEHLQQAIITLHRDGMLHLICLPVCSPSRDRDFE